MADDGTFQLNDVVLNIPPEKITSNIDNVKKAVQALRSRSSIKTKSNMSEINIIVECTFTNEVTSDADEKLFNGFHDLRNLIAQFQVTPFCFVENQHLRNSILGGSSNPSMVLALKQLQVHTNANAINSLQVIMQFAWFNYFPYAREWLYKTDFFAPTSTTDPRFSRPWKTMYQAEILRGAAKNLYEIPTQFNDENARLSFTQFATLKVSHYKDLEQDVRALKTLKEKLMTTGANDAGDIVTNSLSEDLGPMRGQQLQEQIFGTTSSQIPEKLTVEQLTSTLDASLGADSPFALSLANRNVWEPAVLNNGKMVMSKDELTASSRAIGEATGNDILVLKRERSLSLNAEESGIILTGVTISFENILATLPLSGHLYPTYQHMGSTDAEVRFHITTTNESSLQALSGFFNTVEDQSMKFKQIPQGQRNVKIANDFVNMCGLYEFITDKLNTETVPGSPGTSVSTIAFCSNPIDASTGETITSGPGFSSRADIRSKITDVIINNTIFNLPAQESVKSIGNANFASSLINSAAVSLGMNDTVTESAGHYVAALGGQDVKRQIAYKDIVETVVDNLNPVIYKIVRHALRSKSDLKALFTLKNNDVPGIESMQNNIYKTLSGRAGLNLAKTNDASPEEINEFIDEFLKDWLDFIVGMTDRILFSDIVNLPQFKAIREDINQVDVATSGTCYPDFPLEQVLEIMQNTDSTIMRDANKALNKASSQNKLGVRNIGLASLIQPDFYMYSNQDEISDVVPYHIGLAASNAIIAGARESKPQVEKSWLKNIYQGHVIGKELATQIRSDAIDTEYDSSLWNNKENEELQVAIKAAQAETKGNFHFDDLVDVDDHGLGCSILTESWTHGDIKLQDLSIADIFANRKRIPGTYFSKRRSGVNLSPDVEHHSKVKHFFGSDSIALKSPNIYLPAPRPSVKLDPNKEPDWQSPVPSSFKISSGWGPRSPPVPGASKFHEAIDLVSSAGREFTRGSLVRAAADGEIIFARGTPWTKKTKKKSNNGNYIIIKHSGGYASYYLHLEWSHEVVTYGQRFHADNKKPIPVKKGDPIGRIGSTGVGTGAHLDFRIWKGGFIDPTNKISGKFHAPSDLPAEKSQGPVPELNAVNSSLLNKSMDQLAKDIKLNQGYNLMRAYPTFRLYFIESDLGERRRYSFDDFFSYSSVEEITVIRSRKIPADMAILSLTNVSGVLSNRKFKNSVLRDSDGNSYRGDEVTGTKNGIVTTESMDVRDRNTDLENPLDSLMLKPGQQIQLRLGCSNNPDELETVMNGMITEVTFNESDDMVQIVCQSFGIEMIQNQHGNYKSFGGLFSSSGRTGKLLEELLATPDVVHFGRWEGGAATNTAYGILKNQYNATPKPRDDNIFAPTGRGIWGFFDSTPEYVLYKNTIWDVFQEMTLRIPGYVAYGVPYAGLFGPRMTMFFGLPDQTYFARDPSFVENNKAHALATTVANASDNLTNNRSALESFTDPFRNNKLDTGVEIAEALADSQSNVSKLRGKWLQDQIKTYALDQGFIKPFRNYHVATSTHHILMNNITASGNTFNTVTLQYGDEAASVNEGNLVFGDLETMTLKADAAIQDEDTRELLAQYHNCVGYEMAKRYCVGLLFNALKENYQGSLVIMGNAKIKPHDIVYVFDEYSDMFGPVEVEQSITRMSKRNGYITEITPDMVVHVNQSSTLSTSDAMGLIAESALKAIGIESLPTLMTKTNQAIGAGGLAIGAAAASSAGATLAATAATVGAVSLIFDVAFTPIANAFFNSDSNALSQNTTKSPFGMVGVFVFRKLITRSQLAHPFRYSPLVKGGQPMIAGLPIVENQGSLLQQFGEYLQDGVNGAGEMITDFAQDIRPNNWLGTSQGNLLESLLGE